MCVVCRWWWQEAGAPLETPATDDNKSRPSHTSHHQNTKHLKHNNKTTTTTKSQQAVFDNAELEEVRSVRPAGIAILGFKPQQSVGLELTAGTARFASPDEAGGRGSTAAFVALHKAMLDQVGWVVLIVKCG